MFNIDDYLSTNTAYASDCIDPDKVIYYSPEIVVNAFDRQPKLVLIYTDDVLDQDTVQSNLIDTTIIATIEHDTEVLYAFYIDGKLYKYYVEVPEGLEIELDERLVDSKETFRKLLVLAIAERLESKILLKAVMLTLTDILKINT